MADKKIILISTGDPSGIGPEICMKTLNIINTFPDIKLVPVGNFEILQEAGDLTGYSGELKKITKIENIQSDLNDEILNIDLNSPLDRGRVSKKSGLYTYELLKTCTELCLTGKCYGIVTGPVNKEALELAGQRGKGHTELFKEFTGVNTLDTVFCIENLKIFFLSRHVSLLEAIKLVKKKNILDAIIRIDKYMKEMGYTDPKIGIPGLNPHCSDGGLFGREEIDEIIPAVKEAQKIGISVEGPTGADSIYHLGIRGYFNSILSLYHDQGHIASKTYDFYKTVTITLGLPFLRTSVDHGTGFDIAWKGVASPESLIRAIELMRDLIKKK